MNKNKLGRMLENKVNNWLKQAGWKSWLVQPKMIYVPNYKYSKKLKEKMLPDEKKYQKEFDGHWISKPQDIWGADILAIKVNNINLAIQVTADSGLGRKAKEFSEYPYNQTWLCLIFHAKKKSGKWVFFVYEARDGKYFPVCPEKLESIFGKSWGNIAGKIVYET
jgi:hypothetical protein